MAEQQAQQESLQTYLGDMGELILRDTSPLPEASPDDAVSRLAQAKTLTVLGGLDGERKGIVIRFLAEAGLILREGEIGPIIALSSADLSYADLSYASGVTKDQLEQQTILLEGATMPDGSEHP